MNIKIESGAHVQITDKSIVNVFGDVVQHKEVHIHPEKKTADAEEAENEELCADEVNISGTAKDERPECQHPEQAKQGCKLSKKPKAVKASGRPKSDDLASCFREGVDAQACIERMRPFIVGERGKQVVLVLKAAYKLEWFEKMPIFPQLVREYGELGRASGFGAQMRSGYFSDDEVQTMMNKLKG